MDNLLIALLGIVGILFGLYLRERSKAQSSQALADNVKSKEEVATIQKDVDSNDAKIAEEKQKQADLQKNLDEEKKKDVSQDDLLHFFNTDDK